MSNQPDSTPQATAEAPDKGVGCDALFGDDTPRTLAARANYINSALPVSDIFVPMAQMERELYGFKRSNERIIADYNALLRDLKAAQLDCGHAEKRCEAAIASWDEERERALREAARVTRLLRVCEDMMATYRDDAKEVLVTQERMEAWRSEIAAVMSSPNSASQTAAPKTET